MENLNKKDEVLEAVILGSSFSTRKDMILQNIVVIFREAQLLNYLPYSLFISFSQHRKPYKNTTITSPLILPSFISSHR